MSFTEEKKKSPWGKILVAILLVGVLIIALCDFAPKQTTVQTTIQHSVD